MYDFLNSFSDTQQLSTSAVIARLLICFTLSTAVALFYQRVYRNNLPIKEITPLILLALCICSVLMSIGNSIPHSFGLFAALTLIRFRTPVKSSKDLVTLFFFIVIGITCGLGHFKVAIISITFITASVYMIGLINQSALINIILQIHYKGASLNEVQANITEKLCSFSQSVKILEIRSINLDETEFVFEFKIKSTDRIAEIIDQIKPIPGVQQAFIQTPLYEAEAF